MEAAPSMPLPDAVPEPGQEREGVFGLRATIDRAPIGIAHFDSSGQFLLVNDRLCEILGFTRDELLARTFQQITFPEDLPHCLELTAQLARGEIRVYKVEKRFVSRDGCAVWTRITVSAVRRSDGSPAFFIGVAEDISGQIAAQEAQRNAEERLRTALSASLIGTFRFDVRRNALDWADGLERLFGNVQNTTLEEFFAMIHPDDRARVMESYVSSAGEGADFEEDFRVIWPDGSIHWLHDRGQTVAGADGEPHYIIGAITDITTQKKLEVDRMAAEERRKQMLAFVAHDLRNPVQTIVMSASSIVELNLTDEQRGRQLDIIKRSAWRMDRLIGDLLDASSIEAGTFAVRRERVLVPDLLAEIVDAFEGRAHACGVALSCEIDPRVSPIKGDRERLVQLLSNLVANALKFTRPGGRVSLFARQVDRHVEIAVEDTGIGIRAEHKAKVFDRFWQADRVAGGAGLGLMIAKGIAEAHEGEIILDSTFGQGTTFYVRLPHLEVKRRGAKGNRAR
jgi:PAS domain S-box-containing protein